MRGATLTRPPFEFAGPYAGCYAEPIGTTDKRHVYMMHGILSAWPFRHALEIGSYNGATATAFVEAIGKSLSLATFCDLYPSKSLRDVVAACRDQNRVNILAQRSVQVLENSVAYDFIFVDACHDIASVTPEVQRLMWRRPLCVMAHDTNATAAGYPACEGAEMLKRTFESQPDYLCIEDNRQREGERTERGLFLATKDEDLFRIAREVFEKWN